MTTTHAARGAVIDRLLATLDIDQADVFSVSTLEYGTAGADAAIHLNGAPPEIDGVTWEPYGDRMSLAVVTSEDLTVRVVADRQVVTA